MRLPMACDKLDVSIDGGTTMKGKIIIIINSIAMVEHIT
jgi:hypothetical protein